MQFQSEMGTSYPIPIETAYTQSVNAFQIETALLNTWVYAVSIGNGDF